MATAVHRILADREHRTLSVVADGAEDVVIEEGTGKFFACAFARYAHVPNLAVIIFM